MAASQRAKFWHEMRVGKEANIENKVSIFGHALAKSEAYTRNEDALFLRLLVEDLVDVCAQFVHVEFRCVDDEVGQAADRAEVSALFFQGRLHRRIGP